MKTTGFIKVIVSLIAIVVVVLLGFQLYNYFYLSVQTEYAVKATMEDTFSVSGIVCRNEYLLKKELDGYYDIALSNGEKVSKGGIIAGIYSEEDDVKAKEQIRLLQAQMEEYNAAISAKSSYTDDGSIYEQNIHIALSDYSAALQDGDSFMAQEALDSFEKQVLIKEIISGKNTNYQEIITDISSQIKTLESSVSGVVRNVLADQSGYFTTDVDGFEGVATSQAINEMSASECKKLIGKVTDKTQKVDGLLGKIVLDYSSDFYFVASASAMKDYKLGDSIYLRFPSVSDDKIKCQIIKLSSENNEILVGVSCSNAHADLFSTRVVQADVITKTYNGIRVDKESVRILDGKNGVYVKSGSIVKFKKVNILYMGTTYALIEEEPNGVVNFDEVIVGGRDIYDGKVLA